MKKIECYICKAVLTKDYVALNRKLINRHVEKYFCIDCMAEHLDCAKIDLLVKIDEFKEQGCGLF